MKRPNLEEELYLYENRPVGYDSGLHAHRMVSMLLQRLRTKRASLDEIAIEENRSCLD